MSTTDKFRLQDEQYRFPYHHLVQFSPFKNYVAMPWGFEYYAYIEKVLEHLKKIPFTSLLDVGCGEGKLLLELRPRFKLERLKGIDLSERAILFAKAFNFNNGVDFTVEDIANLRETFDCITLIETVEHISDSEIPAFIQAIFDHLASNGTVIVSVPTTNFPLQEKHYRHYTKNLLEEQFHQFTLQEVSYLVRQGTLYRFCIRLSRKLCSLVTIQKYLLWFVRKTVFQGTPSTARHIVAVFKKSAV